MSRVRHWFLSVAIACISVGNATCALAQIIPDSTLPNNSNVVIQSGNTFNITGGTQAGINLFHSFKEFSVPTGGIAIFNNATNIQNIISRVTGRSVSNINGLIRANGTANLFLINQNGIIFGPNARVNIGGSFIGSTASSLKFADGTEFSGSAPQTIPLLTISVPTGLQFGANPASIINNSRSRSGSGVVGGLQPNVNKTLALVGGNINLKGGNLTLAGGRVELGGLAEVGVIGLLFESGQLRLSFPDNVAKADIQLTGGSQVNVTSGSANIRARSLSMTDGSSLSINTLDQRSAANISIVVDDLVSLANNSYIFNGVEFGAEGNGGDINITTGSLSLTNGAQLLAATFGLGKAGNVNIDARDRVSFDGASSNEFSSGAFSYVGVLGLGNAGNINITAGSLSITNGAQLSASTFGLGNAGNLNVNVRDSVELNGTSADGQVVSSISAAVERGGIGNGGDLRIATGSLSVRNGAEVNVSGRGEGNAGNLQVITRDLRLDNQGKLLANSVAGNGANITLRVKDLLLLRRNSQISAVSGTAQSGGSGGNFNLDITNGFIIAAKGENSDIVTNAFAGTGGKINITALGIFGMVVRSRGDLENVLGTNDPTQLDPRLLPTNDIVAISQTSSSFEGVTEDSTLGLVPLPTNFVEATQHIITGCNRGGRQRNSSFTATGRSGLPPSPIEPLTSDASLVTWVTPPSEVGTTGGGDKVSLGKNNTSAPNSPTQIVEAQSWVMDGNGDIVLIAGAPATPYNPTSPDASCSAL